LRQKKTTGIINGYRASGTVGTGAGENHANRMLAKLLGEGGEK
jgi:hypothetical protein